MANKWNVVKFLSLLEQKKSSDAFNYKKYFIPSNLYKYCPLFDKSLLSFRKNNSKRLSNLQENSLWVSNYKSLNDPFEFKSLFLDREKIKEYGWNSAHADQLENWLDSMKSQFQICCFSNCAKSNMPLWAHYSNNHKGYCVEYSVIDKTAIYPVTYINNREPVGTMPTRLYTEYQKVIEKGIKTSDDFNKYLTTFYLSFSHKDIYWEYECEYRFFTNVEDIKIGTLIPLKKANLKIEKIFIGISSFYKRELLNIGKTLGCEVYEMIFNEYSPNFVLESKRII